MGTSILLELKRGELIEGTKKIPEADNQYINKMVTDRVRK